MLHQHREPLGLHLALVGGEGALGGLGLGVGLVGEYGPDPGGLLERLGEGGAVAVVDQCILDHIGVTSFNL